jgi:hypothetical protein
MTIQSFKGIHRVVKNRCQVLLVYSGYSMQSVKRVPTMKLLKETSGLGTGTSLFTIAKCQMWEQAWSVKIKNI